MGNQLASALKDHELGIQEASAGPNCSWKIFNATRKNTKEHVSLWFFDKKAVPQTDLKALGPFCDMLRRNVRIDTAQLFFLYTNGKGSHRRWPKSSIRTSLDSVLISRRRGMPLSWRPNRCLLHCETY